MHVSAAAAQSTNLESVPVTNQQQQQSSNALDTTAESSSNSNRNNNNNNNSRNNKKTTLSSGGEEHGNLDDEVSRRRCLYNFFSLKTSSFSPFFLHNLVLIHSYNNNNLFACVSTIQKV